MGFWVLLRKQTAGRTDARTEIPGDVINTHLKLHWTGDKNGDLQGYINGNDWTNTDLNAYLETQFAGHNIYVMWWQKTESVCAAVFDKMSLKAICDTGSVQKSVQWTSEYINKMSSNNVEMVFEDHWTVIWTSSFRGQTCKCIYTKPRKILVIDCRYI